MSSTINIRIKGKYGAISELEWLDVPQFAVVMEVNGAGKSQLLEVIAAEYGAWEPRNPFDHASYQEQGRMLGTDVHAEIEGDEFAHGEVFHSYDEWQPPRAISATEEQVKEAIRILYSDNGLVPEGMKVRATIASKNGITPEEVGNLSPDQFYEDLTPRQLIASMGAGSNTNLPLLFLTYQLFEREARAQGLSREQAIDRYGEPPWPLLNKILETSGLPFRFEPPGELNPSKLFVENTLTLSLRDIQRDIEVPFEGLSSGEKVIMSTVFWWYNAQQMGTYPRFLLLDEPDRERYSKP